MAATPLAESTPSPNSQKVGIPKAGVPNAGVPKIGVPTLRISNNREIQRAPLGIFKDPAILKIQWS